MEFYLFIIMMKNKETVVIPLQEAVLFHSGEVLS